VQTEVVQVVPSWAERSQSRTRSSESSGRLPSPPGTRTMSGSVSSSIELVASSPSRPVSVRFTPASGATNSSSAPGSRDSTSYGPIASSAVSLSKIRIAIFIVYERTTSPASAVARPIRLASG
jgi:hypothetical protein